MTIPQGQGKELPLDQLPPVDESKLKEYPMVWHNEVTGKPAFMVHAIIAQKLLLKTSPDSEVKVMDNVDEIRAWLYKISRRMVEPANILVAPFEEGDIAVWNNRVSLYLKCYFTTKEDPKIKGADHHYLYRACSTLSLSILSLMDHEQCIRSTCPLRYPLHRCDPGDLEWKFWGKGSPWWDVVSCKPLYEGKSSNFCLIR